MNKQLTEFIQKLPDVTDLPRNIPAWLHIHFLICASPASLSLPHESADFSLQEYVQWFNEHSNVERYQFLQNLVYSFEQFESSVQASSYLPGIKALLQKELTTQKV